MENLKRQHFSYQCEENQIILDNKKDFSEQEITHLPITIHTKI